MFSTRNSKSAYTDSFVDAFSNAQAKPVDMTTAFPGHKTHVRCICNAMRAIYVDIAFVKDALTRWDGDEWLSVVDSVSTKLSRSAVMLQGQLDAMVMCSNDRPGPDVTFNKTVFRDDAMATVQAQMKGLESRARSGQRTWADFYTVSNFWKHYIPYQPLPVSFAGGFVDFQAVIGNDRNGDEIKTGPLLRDLILPVYEGARTLLGRLIELYRVDIELPPELSMSKVS